MTQTYKMKKSEPPHGAPPAHVSKKAGRLTSLDAFRGFIMIVLAAHGFGFEHFSELPADAPAWKTADYDTWQTIGFHFRHTNWIAVDQTHWLSFWDLIQPAFMFMVGVAMPFSYARRSHTGQSSGRRTFHALIRSVVLVLMGVFLYSLGHERTNWIFPNVLAQIGLGYFFVYLLLNRTPIVQLSAIAAILIGYWALFYFNPPPQDYDYAAVGSSLEQGVEDNEIFTDHMAPWSKNSNAAFRFDQWLLPQLRTPANEAPNEADAATSDDAEPAGNGNAQQPSPGGLLRQWFLSNPEPYKYNRSGYTTLNFIPSIATALLGVLCGQLLIPRRNAGSVLLALLLGGGICIALGLAAHITVCPIIKIIWTPSWALFSGGCVIWMLAVFYLLFDVLPLGKLAWPLQVIGVNSLAVYLMGELLRGWVGHNVVQIHLAGFLESVIGTEALSDQMFGRIIGPTSVAVIFWLLAVYMYRKRIYVRV